MKRYREIVETAEDAERRGDWRLAMNKYYEAVLAAPSKWVDDRFMCLVGYYYMLKSDKIEQGATPTEEHVKTMKRIAADEEEPVLFRAQALMVIGKVYLETFERERAGEYYRLALDMTQTATPAERERRCEKDSTTAGDLLGHLVEGSKDMLNVLEDPTRFSQYKGIFYMNGMPPPPQLCVATWNRRRRVRLRWLR